MNWVTAAHPLRGGLAAGGYRKAAGAFSAAMLILAGCNAAVPPGSDSTGEPAGGSAKADSSANGGVTVEEMISGSGPYSFPDPYPVYRSRHGTSVADPHIIFGTSDAVLLCPGAVQAGCYSRRQVTINIAPEISAHANAADTVITATQNHNPFQSENGAWDMAMTVSVKKKSDTSDHHWSVVMHAHPSGATDPVPTAWIADSALEGSLARDERANYDGKYYESAGNLYLIYSKRLSDRPAHDGVVAQPMINPRQSRGGDPVVLLAPTPDAGFSSEDFFAEKPKSKFKLVETGNISQVNGKYVMAYSTGAFDENDYKSGVAWSDTFLPAAGSTYVKRVVADPDNLWHNPTHQDVDYLMQSQRPRWTHFVGEKVRAPGVPAIVEDQGKWYLIFAGYQDPGPPPPHFKPATRKPLFTPLCLTGDAMIANPCAHS